MFWDTIVMAEAVKLANEHIGPMGRYLEKPDHAAVGLYTQEAGKFWYGDLDSRDKKGLQALATSMKETLYVIPELGDTDDSPLHEQAFMEIAP